MIWVIFREEISEGCLNATLIVEATDMCAKFPYLGLETERGNQAKVKISRQRIILFSVQ